MSVSIVVDCSASIARLEALQKQMPGKLKREWDKAMFAVYLVAEAATHMKTGSLRASGDKKPTKGGGGLVVGEFTFGEGLTNDTGKNGYADYEQMGGGYGWPGGPKTPLQGIGNPHDFLNEARDQHAVYRRALLEAMKD